MASKKSGRQGAPGVLTDKHFKEIEALYYECDGNITEMARRLGIARQSVQDRIKRANQNGYLKAFEAIRPERAVNPFAEIRSKRVKEFERQKAAGTWRKIRPVNLPHNEPYAILFLGDPHLDNAGTDLSLWEEWLSRLDAANGVYGFCLGDYLDNWVRPLAYLYGKGETTAPEGWELLRHYLGEYGKHFIGSVSGNHDDWSGYSDVLSEMMDKAGVLNHRHHAIRLGVKSKNGRMITIGARHRFPGHSQWNTVHGVMRAAKMGWRDNILIGGDKHISGDAKVKDPDSGFITHCYQVAAFKIYDDYAEEKGFLDQHISPGIAVVVDPSKADNDPSLIEPFYSPDSALTYLEALRARRPNA